MIKTYTNRAYSSLANYLGSQDGLDSFRKIGGSGGGGGSTKTSTPADIIALVNSMIAYGGGTWTNTGSGFSNMSSQKSLDYFGNQLFEFIIPEVVLTGNSSTWGKQIQNHVNAYMNIYNARTRLYDAQSRFWGTKPDAVSISFGGSINGFFFSGNFNIGVAINLRGGDIGGYASYGGNMGIHGGMPGIRSGFQASQHNNYGGNADVIEGLGGEDVGYSGSFFLGGAWSKSARKNREGALIPTFSGVETTSINLGVGWEATKTHSNSVSYNFSKWFNGQ